MSLFVDPGEKPSRSERVFEWLMGAALLCVGVGVLVSAWAAAFAVAVVAWRAVLGYA